MTLLKTSLLGASAFAARLLSNVVLNKVLAVTVGPSGFALVGQVQNFLGIIQALAGGFMSTGATRGIAALGQDESAIEALSKTTIVAGLLLSTLFAAAIILFSEQLAVYFLFSPDYAVHVGTAGSLLPLSVTGLLLLAILNGRRSNVAYTVINILASFAGLFLVAYLSFRWELRGAIFGVILASCALFLFSSLYSVRAVWFRLSRLVGAIDKASLKMLFGPALMAITAACIAPLLQIAIRAAVKVDLGLDAAGYWQALWKLSELFMLLFTTSLTIYYLPRLAEIKTKMELRREVIGVTLRVLPVATVISAFVILLREHIVIMMLSREFSPITNLVSWQLGADLVKLGSWIVAYVMIARALVVEFVLCEISFGLIFWVLANQFLATHGLVGIALAQLVTYLGYWIVAGAIAWRESGLLNEDMVRQ